LDAGEETADSSRQSVAVEETADSRRQSAEEEIKSAVSDTDGRDKYEEEGDEEEDWDDEDDEEMPVESDKTPSRVVGTDGKSYPAKKTDKPKTMSSFGELAASLPYSYEEQSAAQAVIDAVFALPVSLTLRVHEGRLIITSTDPDKPTLRDCPLQRGTDWQHYPIRPFFNFSAGDWDILENGGINTVGDLAKLISTDPKEQKTLPKFGKKKIVNLEEQFEAFWMAHPELCNP
jgi:hypothetical protein